VSVSVSVHDTVIPTYLPTHPHLSNTHANMPMPASYLGLQVGVGLALEQERDDVGVIVGGCPVQRRYPILRRSTCGENTG